MEWSYSVTVTGFLLLCGIVLFIQNDPLHYAALLVYSILYTVFQKKTSTHIIGYKLRNSCPILIIFDNKIPHII